MQAGVCNSLDRQIMAASWKLCHHKGLTSNAIQTILVDVESQLKQWQCNIISCSKVELQTAVEIPAQHAQQQLGRLFLKQASSEPSTEQSELHALQPMSRPKIGS